MIELKYTRGLVQAGEEAGGKGRVEMLVAVMENVDLGGDKIVPGAFEHTLSEWEKRGDPIPVIWSHQWDEPEAHIGVVLEAAEREVDGKRGLWTLQQWDLEKAKARQVFDLAKERRVTQASFAYWVRKHLLAEPEEGEKTPRWDGKVRELHDLDLLEVGPTLLGMNPQTELLEAASAVLLRAGASAAKPAPDPGPEAAGDTDATMVARALEVLTVTRHASPGE
jgi:HK97 family phage prohead protease